MRAVSNTSPLSSLAVIGRLSLLRGQFSEIWIPTAVSQELDAHPDPAALAAIQAAIHEKWIRVASPAPSRLLSVLCLIFTLDEAEGSNSDPFANLYVWGRSSCCAALRILPDSAALCRTKLLISFGISGG